MCMTELDLTKSNLTSLERDQVKDQMHQLVAWVLGSEHLLYYYTLTGKMSSKEYNETYCYYVRGLLTLSEILYTCIQVDLKRDATIEDKSAYSETFDEVAYQATHPLLFPRLFDLFDLTLYKEGGSVYEKYVTFITDRVPLTHLREYFQDFTPEEYDFLDFWFQLFAESNNHFYNMFWHSKDIEDEEDAQTSSVTLYDARPLIVHVTSSIQKYYQIPKSFEKQDFTLFSSIALDHIGHITLNYQDTQGHKSSNIAGIFFSKTGFSVENPLTLSFKIPETFLSSNNCIHISMRPSFTNLSIGALILILMFDGAIYNLPTLMRQGKDILLYMYNHDYKIPRTTYGELYLRYISSGLTVEQAKESANANGCSIAIL